MNIPPRYQDVKYEDIPAELRRIFEAMPKTRRGVYIHGPVGTGKTHAIWAMKKRRNELATEAMKSLKRVMPSVVYNVTELLHRIRSEFDRKNEDILAELMEFDGILFLDDIGSEKMTEWVTETFYMLINSRYEQMRPTVFTSNLLIEDLAERIGDRTTSRILEMCDIYHLKGHDRRLAKVIHRKGALQEKTK